MLLGAADVPKKVVCSNVLDDSQAATFRKAVKKHYWYELFMDELPVWGFVGLPPEEAKDDEHIYIYTHKSLEINYNGDRVSFLYVLYLQSGINDGMQLLCMCCQMASQMSEELSSMSSSACSDKACCLTCIPYYVPCYCILYSRHQLCIPVDAVDRDIMVQDACCMFSVSETVYNIVPSRVMNPWEPRS